MESLLHSTDNLGFAMLHCAAQEGHAEVVQLLIDEYKLNPTARSKVCGQTCRCLENSSRASGRFCTACRKCALVTNECEHEQN